MWSSIDNFWLSHLYMKIIFALFVHINFCKCFVLLLGCCTVEALEAATLHPAQLLGITSKKGTLEFESDADLVFLDDEFRIHATFISGFPVYINENGCISRSFDSFL